MTTTLESQARFLWAAWGNAWQLYTSCSHCHEVQHCRGRKRHAMLCLECFDQTGGK